MLLEPFLPAALAARAVVGLASPVRSIVAIDFEVKEAGPSSGSFLRGASKHFAVTPKVSRSMDSEGGVRIHSRSDGRLVFGMAWSTGDANERGIEAAEVVELRRSCLRSSFTMGESVKMKT